MLFYFCNVFFHLFYIKRLLILFKLKSLYLMWSTFKVQYLAMQKQIKYRLGSWKLFNFQIPRLWCHILLLPSRNKYDCCKSLLGKNGLVQWTPIIHKMCRTLSQITKHPLGSVHQGLSQGFSIMAGLSQNNLAPVASDNRALCFSTKWLTRVVHGSLCRQLWLFLDRLEL